MPHAVISLRNSLLAVAAVAGLSVCISVVEALATPKLPLEPPPVKGLSTAVEQVKAVTVTLSDPSLGDRLMATLPSILTALLYLFAVACALLVRRIATEAPDSSQSQASGARYHMKNTVLLAFMGVSAVIMISDFLVYPARSWYFGDSLGRPVVSTPEDTTNTVALVIVLVFMILQVLDRAGRLADKYKDVV